MWFVIVVILSLNDSTVITIAKEVDSRVQCDLFSDKMREHYGQYYRGSHCRRYVIGRNDGNSSRDNES